MGEITTESKKTRQRVTVTFTLLRRGIVLQVYTYVKTYYTVPFKYVQLIICRLYPNKPVENFLKIKNKSHIFVSVSNS